MLDTARPGFEFSWFSPFLGRFRGRFWSVFGSFWAVFGWFSTWGSPWGMQQGLSFGSFWVVLGQFWVSFGSVLIDTPRLAYGKFSSFGSFRVTFRSIFSKFWGLYLLVRIDSVNSLIQDEIGNSSCVRILFRVSLSNHQLKGRVYSFRPKHHPPREVASGLR